MRRGVIFRAFAAAGLVATFASAAAAVAPLDVPWAFPMAGAAAPASPSPARAMTLPGSGARYSRTEIDSGFLAVDWWPKSHPPLPPVVRHGRPPDVLACGYCHLPGGEGRPENAALAGLTANYIREQVQAIRSGARKGVHPAWLPTAVMYQVAGAVSAGEVTSAAAYFSKLTFVPRTRVVEAADIPAVVPESFVYRRLPGKRTEPLGARIVESPNDFYRFELRDSKLGFVAYVPRGAVARGRELATTGNNGSVPVCTTCHGSGLRGSADVPPLAGRSPTQLLRQLVAFHAGARGGAGAAPMRIETARLSTADMIDLAAYAASLKP